MELYLFEARQEPGLTELLLFPGSKMFQRVSLLRHLIRANDEGIGDMQIVRIGELPPQPGWFGIEFHRNASLAETCGQANDRGQRGIGERADHNLSGHTQGGKHLLLLHEQ